MHDYMPYIVNVLGIAIGSVAFAKLVDWFIANILPSKNVTARQAIYASAAINAALYRFCAKVGAHSALVIESANGEKLTRAGQVMVVTVTHEACPGNPADTIQRLFNETPVDPYYNELLLGVLTSKDGFNWPKLDHIASPMLKELYESRGIKTAFQLRMPSPPSVIRFLSIRFTREVLEHDSTVRAASHECALEIMQAIRLYGGR